MKNNTLFLYLAGIFSLISCGTASHASYSGSQYQNGIYYTPDANAVYAEAKNQQELKSLQEKTKNSFSNSTQRSTYDNKTGTETIYVGDTNLVNISYNPNVTYSIVDDDESYESRLRKFDSPTYTININLDNNDYPWWDVNFGWYRPYGITWGTGWYNPWWGPYYSWYGPRWSWGWNSWYAWDGFYDPWYNPWYRPYWHNHHWHGGGYWPVPGPRRDVYYGRRESGPSYNNRPANNGGSYTRRDPSMNQIRGNNGTYTGRNPNSTQQGNSGSSYNRGGATNHNGAIYNNSAANKGQQQATTRPGYRPNNGSGSSQQGNSIYRRSSTQSSTINNSGNSNRNNNETYRNESNYNRNNNNNTYNRNSNTNNNNYNRSNYNQNSGNNSSYGTGSSYRGSTSGTTSGGGGTSSGSSYRRR